MKLVTLSLLLVVTWAQAQVRDTDWYDRRVMMVNQTDDVVIGIYGSNVDSRSWEENIIPAGKYLLPGYEVRVDFNDGTGYCLFDIRIVYLSGDTGEKRGMNVCELETINLTD